MDAARTETAPAARAADSRSGHRSSPPARLGPAGGTAGVLALQRVAGNAATGATLRRGGILARCGGGSCTCGGSCGGAAHDEDAERELAGGRAMARAVSARRAGA